MIEARYAGMISSFIAKNLAVRPVYVTGEIEWRYTPGYQRVPAGLAFRLYADTLFHVEARPAFRFRPFPRAGRLEDMTRRMYADALTARGEYYYSKRADRAEAKYAFLSAISFDPSAPLPKRWLAAFAAGTR